MPDLESIYESIRAQRAEITKQRAALDQEDAELAVMERRIAAYLPNCQRVPSPAVSVGNLAASIVASVTPQPKRGRRKPGDVPPVFRMACDILRDSTAQGKPWLDTQEITAEIRRRWWPGAEAAFVQPQLWRAATKRNALLKDGARYALPNTNGKGPALQAEPSLRNDVEVDAVEAPSTSSGRGHLVEELVASSAPQPHRERRQA